MADRAFSTLVPRVSTSATGCDFATMEKYIRDAAINACERTLGYRYAVPPFLLEAGVHEYAYNVPTNTQVCAILGANLNHSPMEMVTLEDALRRFPDWADLYNGLSPAELWDETESGAVNASELNSQEFNGGGEFTLPDAAVEGAAHPSVITQVTTDKYVVLPFPDRNEYRLRMFVALKPKRDATGFDSVAFDRMEDIIFHRTLQNLLILPKVPWSDRELATYHAKQYTFLASQHYAHSNIGNQRASLSVRNVPFA